MNRPVIAWLHGWSFTPEVWGDIEAKLPDYKHLYIEDGASYVPTEKQMLIGWSLGAMQAIQLATNYPKLVTGIILLAGTLQFCSTDRTMGWPTRVIQRMLDACENDASQVVIQFRAQLTTEQTILTAPQADDKDLMDGLFQLRETDLRDIWPTLQTPHLWIHGESDTICPVAAIPQDANVVRLPDVGHVPFLEEACWQAIRGWLDAHSESNRP
jgi:pimeloyl-[acyl-carrier protein] methyl ester esterase